MYLTEKGEDSRCKYLIMSGIIFKILICSLIVTLGFDYIASRKFHVDANKIYSCYLSFSGSDIFEILPFSGFDNTAKLYRILFFDQEINMNTFFILTSIMYMFLFLVIIKNIKVNYNQKAFFVFLILFIFDSIFLCQPSKDFFSLVESLILLKLFISKNKYSGILIFCTIALYAYFFRAYYFITLLLFVLFKITYAMHNKKRIKIYFSCFAVFTFLFYGTSVLNDIINIKQVLYLTIGACTNTFIKDLIPCSLGEKNLIKFLVNYITNGIRILLPFELLKTSTMNAFIFIPVQLLFVNVVYKYIKVLRQNSIPIEQIKDIQNIILYLIAFLLTSFLFEPDFGSVFRHNINLMPFVLYLYFSRSYKQKELNELEIPTK